MQISIQKKDSTSLVVKEIKFKIMGDDFESIIFIKLKQ